ncbi:MAG: GNAT family N-acetyltransferase [Pseudomonadota bacterium]
MNGIQYQRLLDTVGSQPLLSLYQRSIAAVGDDLYSATQRAAWAHWADDVIKADAQLRQGLTVMALTNGTVVGFAQLYPGHLVNMLYVDEGWQRQGIGKGLVLQLEAVARQAGITTLWTRASSVSFALFQRLGFEAAHQEKVRAAEGVALTRTLMQKPLAPGDGTAAQWASVDDNGTANGSVITRKGH